MFSSPGKKTAHNVWTSSSIYTITLNLRKFPTSNSINTCNNPQLTRTWSPPLQTRNSLAHDPTRTAKQLSLSAQLYRGRSNLNITTVKVPMDHHIAWRTPPKRTAIKEPNSRIRMERNTWRYVTSTEGVDCGDKPFFRCCLRRLLLRERERERRRRRRREDNEVERQNPSALQVIIYRTCWLGLKWVIRIYGPKEHLTVSGLHRSVYCLL